jgi:hypothetical protein
MKVPEQPEVWVTQAHMNQLAKVFNSLSTDFSKALKQQFRLIVLAGAAIGLIAGGAAVAAVLLHLWVMLVLPAVCAFAIFAICKEA